MKSARIELRPYQGIQAIRGIAALIVVIMHACNIIGAFSGNPTLATFAAWPRTFGHLGVDLFFVISGLIIGMQIMKPGTSSGSFIWRRFIRIYPLFWITLAAATMMPLPGRIPGELSDLVAMPWTLFLLDSPKAHPVAWTLVFEVYFYLIAAIALLFPKHSGLVLFAWSIVQFVLILIAEKGGIPKHPFLSSISLELCLGLAIAYFGRKITVRVPILLIGCSAVAAVAGGVFFYEAITKSGSLRLLAWGVPSALIVWGSLAMEIQGAKIPRLATYLGDISYSTYMWHVPIFAGMWTVFQPNTIVGASGFFMLGLLLCLLVSAASYRFIESPLNSLGKVQGKSSSRTETSPLPRMFVDSAHPESKPALAP